MRMYLFMVSLLSVGILLTWCGSDETSSVNNSTFSFGSSAVLVLTSDQPTSTSLTVHPGLIEYDLRSSTTTNLKVTGIDRFQLITRVLHMTTNAIYHTKDVSESLNLLTVVSGTQISAKFIDTPVTGAFGFSPQYSQFAYIKDDTLMMCDINASNCVQIDTNVLNFRFDFNDTRLYYRYKSATAGGELRSFDIAGSAWQSVQSDVGEYLPSPTEAKVAVLMNYTESFSFWDLGIYDETTSTMDVIGTAALDIFDWLPDGSGLVYLTEGTGGDELRIFDTLSGSYTAYADQVAIAKVGTSSNYVYYLENSSTASQTDLFVLDLASGTSSFLAADIDDFWLSPSGQQIALHNNNGTLSLIPSVGGSPVTIDTDVDSYVEPIISPSDDYCAYYKNYTPELLGGNDTGELWCYDMATGSSEMINDTSCMAQFHPDPLTKTLFFSRLE